MLLHFTEFQRSACASSPLRLAVESEIAAPINRSLGAFVSPLQEQGQIEHSVCVVRCDLQGLAQAFDGDFASPLLVE